MGEVVYVSRVRIERIRGPLRRAFLPATEEPVEFGVHDEVADHYGVPRGSDGLTDRDLRRRAGGAPHPGGRRMAFERGNG